MGLRTAHLVVAIVLALGMVVACAEDYGTSLSGRGARGGEGDGGGGGGDLPPVAASVQANADFPRSASCATCHATIAKQWSTSMHARASTSITTVVQTNLVASQKLLGGGPRATFCVNCHAPVQAAVATDGELPVKAPAAAALDDGVSCGACHQFGRTPTSGAGGIASDFSSALTRGATFYGPIADPVPSPAHASVARDTFGDQGALCGNCHNVNLDRDGDARIHVVKDLVLQTTQDEYDAYRQTAASPKTCAQCHMPALSGSLAAADGFAGAPARTVHDHSFVGVDRALDGSPDPQAPARKALLASAATLEVTTGSELEIFVSITNSGAGHALPSGFAFARQMWIELVVDDGAGGIVFTTGAVASPKADLCDVETLASPLAKHVEGCTTADPLLATFQQRLVDRITAKPGNNAASVDARGELIPIAVDPKNEVVLQHLEGGAVPRVRQEDGIAVKPLAPGESRVFRYDLSNRLVALLPGARVTARLLFRALPPYFVRALMDGHSGKNIALEGLEVVEMAKASLDLK